MSLLKCGCELTIEGGYGDDGLSGRDTIEWCSTHRAAAAMVDALRGALAEHDRRHHSPAYCGPEAHCAMWTTEARAILTTLSPAVPADGGGG